MGWTVVPGGGLHFEAKPVNIEPQRGFHVGHSEKGHRLLDVNARSGCECHGSSAAAAKQLKPLRQNFQFS